MIDVSNNFIKKIQQKKTVLPCYFLNEERLFCRSIDWFLVVVVLEKQQQPPPGLIIKSDHRSNQSIDIQLDKLKFASFILVTKQQLSQFEANQTHNTWWWWWPQQISKNHFNLSLSLFSHWGHGETNLIFFDCFKLNYDDDVKWMWIIKLKFLNKVTVLSFL